MRRIDRCVIHICAAVRKLIILSLALVIGALCPGAALADGRPEWIRQMGAGLLYYYDWGDGTTGTAVDTNGNVYIAGSTGIGLDGNMHAGGFDVFIVQYDSSGVKKSTWQMGSSSDDYARGIAVDGSGNVYVAGHTAGGLDGNASSGNVDLFVVKYDSSGAKQWTKQMGSGSGTFAQAVTVDISGNVYVVGKTNGGLDGNTSSGYMDLFVVKYNSSGDKEWTKQMGAGSGSFQESGTYAQAVAVDSSGNVYVTGYTAGGLDGNYPAYVYDCFLLKYNSVGEKKWTRQWGNGYYTFATGVAIDSSGNPHVTGYAYYNLWGGVDGNQNLGGKDIFLTKFDGNGTKQWTKQTGSDGDDYALGIAMDGNDNIFVTGYTTSSMDGNWYSGGTDIFVMKFSKFGTQQWTRQAGSGRDDYAYGVVVYGSGNVYVSGLTKGSLEGNTNTSGNDLFVIKYDGLRDWTRQSGTGFADAATGVAVDGNGNVYVTGYAGGALDVKSGSYAFDDCFLMKYDSAGMKQWTRQWGSNYYAFARGVAIDSSGNPYVAGNAASGVDGNQSLGGWSDIILTKFNGAGVKQWTKQTGSDGHDYAFGIAIDGNDNIYVTGYTTGGLDGYTNAGNNDLFLMKYDTTGVKQWTRQMGSSGDDRAYGVAVDGNGNVYIAGITTGALNGNTNTSGNDLLVMKYNSAGDWQWTRQKGANLAQGRTPWNDEFNIGIIVDASGNVYITGSTGIGLDGYTSAGGIDVFIMKYNSSGEWQLTSQMGSSADDYARGIAIDGDGSFYVTGFTSGELDGNTNSGGKDLFLVKYDSSWNNIWTKQLGTTGDDIATSIAIGVSGKYIAGSSSAPFDGNYASGSDDIILIKYETPIDTVAPTGSITVNSEAAITNSISVSLGLSCSDMGTCRQMQFSNDNATWSTPEAYSASKTWNIATGDGPKTVYARFMDYVGNWSNAYNASITLDTAPPTKGAISINSGGAYTNSTIVTLSLSATDLHLSQMMIGNDSAFTGSMQMPYATTQPWMLPSGDGSKMAYVKFGDSAGNWSQTYSASITLDTASPSGTINIPGSNTNNTSVTLTLFSADATQMQFSNDGASWSTPEPYATSKSWTLSSGDGTKTVSMRYIDSAGNISGIVPSNTITLDRASPNPPAVNGQTPTNNPKPTWTWVSGGNAGNGAYRYSLNDSSMATILGSGTQTSYTPTTALPEGPQNLYVQEMDAVGNWSLSGSFTIIIDTTAPDAPAVTGVALTSNTKPTWTWASGGGGGSGAYRYRLDSSDLTSGATETTQKTFTASSVLTDGVHTLYIQERDDAGNWSLSGTFQTTVDTTAPALPTVTGATPTNNTKPAWTWATGGGGGSGVFRYKLDSADFTSGTSETTATSFAPANALSEGTHTLYVQEKDAAENWSPSGSFAVVIDTTPPSPPANFSGATPTNTIRPVWSWSPGGGGSGNYRVKLDDSNLVSDATAITTTSYSPPVNLPEGPHTLYIQERDIAGNWSLSGSYTILLDITAPTGSVTINSGAEKTKAATVNLTLSCTDSGSGCSQMQFSNDNISWTALELFATSKSFTLSELDGQRSVFVKYKDAAGNLSNAVSSSIILDTTPPVTTATPSGGSYNAIQTVSLTCNDATVAGCSIYYSIDGTAPSILYTGPITVSSQTTLQYFSVDQLGNPEQMKTASYGFNQGFTQLTLELSQPTVAYDGAVMVWGRLQNQSGNNADPTGKTITLTITDPKGQTLLPVTTTIYNNLGNYIFTSVTGFSQKGAYSLQTHFDGSSLLNESTSLAQPLLAGASAGYAILVEGKVPNNEGIDSHNKTANRIYKKLKNRGFVDDNIYYFNYQNQEGVDATPSKAQIQFAVEQWAKGRMNGLPAPLYIIMVDHGNIGKFWIDNGNANAAENDDYIAPSDLASWLSSLESGLTAEALLEKRVVIMGACYSGSFISTLSKARSGADGGRVIITSAAPDEVSYKGPQEGDGVRSGEYFLEEFFTQLERGGSLRGAFVKATEKTAAFTQMGGGSGNSNAPYFDGAVQHPMLDDNGDGKGTNGLTDNPQGDGTDVKTMQLGVGPTYNVNSVQFPVDITQVTGMISLALADTSALLWAKTTDDTQVDSAIWMEIRPPQLILTTQTGGATNQADLKTTRIPMVLNDNKARWEQDPSLASPPVPFTDSGRYEVFYFVRDKETLKLAPMKRSVVYKNKAQNDPPAAFHLLSPANAPQPGTSQPATSLVFTWESSHDTDGLTYTLLISTDPGFNNVVYRKEEIAAPMTYVDSKAGLNDDTTYYWKVEAVDGYGAITSSSEVWSFHTNNTNGIPGIITGIMYSDQTFARIAAATVSVTLPNKVLTTTTAADGTYVIAVDGGTVSLQGSTSNSQSNPIDNINVSAGEATVMNIAVKPSVNEDKGDLNSDGSVDLADAIIALQVLSRMTPVQTVNKAADVDGDGKIGMADVIYILQKVAEVR